MNIIIGCECSGVIREAFREKGHAAWSCDLKPAEDGSKYHLQCDVFEAIKSPAFIGHQWHMGIFHPPCKFISFAAKAYWNQPGRWMKRLEALEFFGRLWDCGIPKLCLENPLGCADAVIEKHTQIIHPYYFGDSDMKKTCLWLKGLPKLVHTRHKTLFENKSHVDKPEPIYVNKSGKKLYYTDAIAGDSKNAEANRARSFQGIAKAMADQWG